MKASASILALALPLLLAAPAAAQDASPSAQIKAASPSAQIKAASPSPASQDEPATVVATVNGQPIYLEDLEGRLGELHGQVSETHRSDFDLDQLMFRLVNDSLLAQEARVLEMDREPPIPQRVEARRRELAVQRLEREEVWAKAEASDAEVRAAFEELYRRVTLRVITTYEKTEAEAVLAELAAGADFDALARERSKDPYGPRGGLVESLPRADLQSAIAAVAFGLEPGKAFGPVSTDIGWAVLDVVSFEPPDEERFEAVQREIRDTVRFRKAEAARQALGRLLRERHPVAVDAGVLAAIERERLPDGRLVPRPADPAAAVARVGEREITAEAYAKALRLRWAGVRNEAAAEAAAPIVLDRMIADHLMEAEALARGHGDTPAVERELRAYETRILVPRYLDEVLAPRIRVDREEAEAYYAEHRESFRKPPRLHLSQVTLASAGEADRVAALAREGADFAWLARQRSIDNHREAGGDKGWVEPQPGVDSFNDKLLAAEVGDVLDPVALDDEHVVFKVTGREEQGTYTFQEVSGNVRQALFDQKANAAIDELVTTLRERSEVVVDEAVLAKLAVTGSVEEAEKAPGGMGAAHGHEEN
jgi:parvulin-like peptidyl-prolyl isomerase